MGTRVRQANSSAVVEIADELVGRYEAQGWVVVVKAKAEPVVPPVVSKRRGSQK